MNDNSEPQWIMFIADTETRDKCSNSPADRNGKSTRPPRRR